MDLFICTRTDRDRKGNIEDYGVVGVGLQLQDIEEAIQGYADNNCLYALAKGWVWGEHGDFATWEAKDGEDGEKVVFHIRKISLLGEYTMSYKCRLDREPDGQPGGWHHSSRTFPNWSAAIEYAAGCSYSREPHVVVAIPIPKNPSRNS